MWLTVEEETTFWGKCLETQAQGLRHMSQIRKNLKIVCRSRSHTDTRHTDDDGKDADKQEM